MQAPSTGREQGRPLQAFLSNTGGYGEGAPGQRGQGGAVGKPARKGEAGRAMVIHTEGHVRPSHPHSAARRCRTAPWPGHGSAEGIPACCRAGGEPTRRAAPSNAESPGQGSGPAAQAQDGVSPTPRPRKLGNRSLECLRKLGRSCGLQWAALVGRESVTRVARESAGKGRKG